MTIRCFLSAALMVLLGAVCLEAQNGAMAPAIPPSFLNSSGVVAANGRLCFTLTGTSTSATVYSDSSLSTPLPNPTVLNILGIPTTNGTTQTSIYLDAKVYRTTLYANGVGNTCNGTPVGAQIWQRD